MDLDLLLRDAAHVADPAALPRWAPPRDRRRIVTPLRATVAATVAAAVTAAAVIVPTLSTGGPGARPPASASAAEVLHRAAIAAGAQPDGGWQEAPYWYSKSTYTRGGTTFTREIWIGHRATGVLRDPGVDDRVMPLGVASFPAGGSSVTWDGLWSLPTDPARLDALLRAGIHGAGNGDDSELFTIVGDLLRESPAPPKLRAALYEVAGRIPGVRLVAGTVRDHAGREGVAVRRDGATLIFSTTDGALLEEVDGDPASPPIVDRDADGTVIGSFDDGFQATYLEAGPRDSAPAPDPLLGK